MTERDCESARAELEEYLHNELCSEDAEDVRRHIETCPECAGEVKVGLMLTDAVRRACKEAAPDELRATVLAQLRGIQATH